MSDQYWNLGYKPFYLAGQNVYPIRYYDLPGQVTHVLFQKRIIQQVICSMYLKIDKLI